MASNGIRDRVAIVGMGCTPFGEHWDKGAGDLLVDAVDEACETSGVPLEAVDAFWLGTSASGDSGITLAKPLKLEGKPVTRVENYCATGSEAFRNASYAVASGAYDVVMAVGVEKLKDGGHSGLTVSPMPNAGTDPSMSVPAMFSLIVPAYAKRFGVTEDELKDVLTHIAWKNHHNGARNPRAQYRREMTKDAIACSPIVAGNLGVMDCSGVADGAAAAILVRSDSATDWVADPLFIKALAFVAGSGKGMRDPDYDFTTFPEVVASARDAYAQAGITSPRDQLAMAEVHDCFTPTELVLMEDLGFAEPGTGWKEVLSGTYDLDGSLPVNPDGGLKSFGHPIGASGLRMLFECWLQLRGHAPEERQIKTDRRLGLTHNLGGAPGECVSFVSVVGPDRDN